MGNEDWFEPVLGALESDVLQEGGARGGAGSSVPGLEGQGLCG